MTVFEKSFRVILSLFFLLGNTRIPIVQAAPLQDSAASYNQELFAIENCSFSSAESNGSSISMLAATGSASCTVDVSSLASGIDLGGLELAFSADAFLGDDAPEASITLSFGTGSPVTINRSSSNAGTETMSSSASIPAGARTITIVFYSVGTEVSNSTVFSNISFKINDSKAPDLQFALSPDSWTNGSVSVTVSASDEDSGVEGIYDSSDTKVGTTSYKYSTSTNDSWTFYAKDNAGNISGTKTITVNKIDVTAPSVPTLSLSSDENWQSLAIPFSVTTDTAGSDESPISGQYRIDDGDWLNFSNGDEINEEGSHTVSARAIDAAGNTSSIVTDTYKLDLTAPTITLDYSAHPQPTGGATVSAEVTDSNSGVRSAAYAAGDHDAGYFKAGSGTALAGSSFDVSSGGIYSVYAEDNVGHYDVKTISVNTYPEIAAIEDQSFNEDSTQIVSFTVGDLESAAGDLSVEASASNKDIFPSVSVTNTAGIVALDLVPVKNANGTSTVTVNVSDADGLTSTRTFSVVVQAVDDAPVANDDSVLDALEDTPVIVDVLANDSDVDTGDSLTIKSVDDPANGTTSVIDDGKKIYYVPDPDWSGDDTFSYIVKDSADAEVHANVTIKVSPLDDAPVISLIPNQTILEDSSTGALNFSVSDVDTDLSAVNVSVSGDNEEILPAENIQLTPGEAGQFTLDLTPAVNANTSNNGTIEDAPVTITITASEGSNTSTRTFSLSVTAVNDAPQISNLDITTKEDTAKVIDVLALANDIENEGLTITATSTASNGSALVNDEHSLITYTPNPDWNGLDSFTYTVTDAGGASTTKTISVSVDPVSDSPVADDVEESINEDSFATVLLAGNATDPDILLNGDQIKITEVSGEKHGVIALAEDGQSFTYTPNVNWNGIETLTYIVSDLANNSDSATATINVAAVNDDPIAEDDTVDATEDTPIPVYVLTNDTDVDVDYEGDNLTIVSVIQPANGSVNISTDYKSLTYTPTLNFNGEDIFTYIMTDGHGRQSEATVKMEVAAVNDAPVISTITDKTINEDTSTGDLAFTVTDVDNLITDVQVSAESADTGMIPSKNITLTDEGEGQFTIALLPAENVNTTNNGTKANSPVTITISASDGSITSKMSFTITIDPVNDDPIALDDSASTNEDTPKDINVLENDSDIEGEALTVSEVGSALHGTATVSSDKKYVTYSPADNYNGSDTFTYTVIDASGGSKTASVQVAIASVNDAPVAGADSVTLNEDIVTTIDVLANDTDVDISSNPGDESLTIDSVGTPSHGSIEVSSNKIVYTPAANYNGSDSFTYVVKDRSNATSTGTVTITVKPVNDSPVFTNLNSTYSVDEDNSITINFNISDVETTTESLMLQVVSQNQTIVSDSKVVLSGLGDGDTATSLKITPNSNQNGNVTFKLTLGDGFVTTIAYFTLTINPINDDPVVAADRYTFTEDNSIVIDMDDLVINDTDIDGDTLSFVKVVDNSLGTGTLSVLDAGQHTYTYTPPANFDQSTTFRYTMTDGTVEKNGTVTLVAIPVNDPPILTLSSGNPSVFDEDTSATINFTISDYETTANKLSVQAGSSDSDKISPDGIAISCDSNGSCSMVLTPEENKNGPVTISLSVSDGSILVQKDIPLTISPIQDPPEAIDDTVSVAMGGTVVIYPLSNDNDPDGDTIGISSLTVGSILGSVVNNENGSLTYTAPTGKTGTDSFTYTINDGNSNTDTGAITITISGENNSPEITKVGDQYINEDTPTSAISFSVSDPDADDILSLSKSSDDPGLISTDGIVVTKTGTNTYTVQVTPNQDQNGTASITLTVSDGIVSTSTSFTVVVYPVNDAPIAFDDILSTNEDTTLNFTSATLLANDTDVDNDTLQITKVTDPSHGRLTYTSSTGIYSYAPDGNYNGTDSINYTITDGKVTAEAVVNITVVPVNDAPVAYSDWWTVAGSLGATRNADVRPNDYDIETADSNLTVIIVTQPSYGVAAVQANGTVTYTRDSTNYSSDWKDSFTYRVKDDDASPKTSNIATVYIDDYWGPSIYGDDQWFETDEDTAKSMNLAIHDGYAQGYTVSFSTPTLGTITDTNSADNAITYTPKPNVYGTETVTYSLTSNYTGNPTGSGKFYITIYPINDAPEITGSLPDMTTNEDTPSAAVAVTISDVETAAKDLIFTASSSNSKVLLDSGISISRTNGDISFTMTPIANRYGSTTITLLVSDGAAQTTRSFNLTVDPVNDTPVADDLNSTTNEDNPIKITVVSSASDIDGDALSVSITKDPQHGSLTINEDKTITYSPALNFNGSDSFIYELTDPSESSDTGLVSITVNPVNDPPEISNLAYNQTTLEDTPKAVTFDISDVDDTLSTSSVTITTDNATLFPDGSIAYSDTDGLVTVTLTPAANLSGTAIQTVTVTDGKVSATQTFKMTVTPVNDAPTAVDDSFATNEDEDKTFDVISNDSDIETGSLTVVSFVKPDHGTVVNNRNGTLTYSPDDNWNGIETFTYTISDVNNGQSSATITATVYPVNDAPVTVTDRSTIAEDNPVTLNVLANDYDIEGSALTLTDVADPAKGSVVNNGGGSITYTPDLNVNGSDSFTYTVSDGELTSTGTVVITITAVNDAPAITTPTALPWQLYEDTPKTFPVTITDPETASDNLVVKITSSNQSLIPDTSISLTGSGENKYIQLSPLLNKFGELFLTIDVSDGVNTTTVKWTVDVISVNDLPTITNVADQTVNEDNATSALSFTVADIETAGADLSVTGKSSNTALIPDANIVIAKTGSGGRTVVVTPAANAVGSSTITLTVTDADGGSATNTFKVTVNAVNDAPQAKDDTASVDEDNSVVIYTLENDIDADLSNEGDSLTIVSTSNVSSGSVAIASNGKSITYTPVANFNGTATFKYTMQDKNSVQSTALVTVSIAPVNDPPTAVIDSATTSEDTSKVINVLSNDTDIDLSHEGDTLAVSKVENFSNGTAVIAEDGKSVTFTPAADFFGTAGFDYTVSDKENATSSAHVTVTVSAVNDTPVISDIPDQTTAEDTSTGAISFTVSDVDNDPGLLTVSAVTGNGTIIPTSNISLGGSGSTRTISILPAANLNTWNKSTSTHNPVTITVTVSDGSLSRSDSFTVTVTPVNDAPVAAIDSATTPEDTAKSISVLANDSDVDIANEGDSILIFSAGNGTNGTVSVAADKKSLTYTPNLNFNGTDSFTYTITDLAGVTSTATVNMTVTAVNDAPTITTIANQTMDEDTTLGPISFTIDDVDNTASSLTVTAVSSNTTVFPNSTTNISLGGTTGSRTITLKPAANQNTWISGTSSYGTVTITMTVKDSGNLTAVKTFTAQVNKVNDAPVANTDSATVSEDSSVLINAISNDSDVDIAIEGDTISIKSVDSATHGTASLSGGKISYVPDADYFGTAQIGYTITDLAGATASAVVNVTVTPVNDKPLISDVSDLTINEDSSTDALNFTISDIDNPYSELTVTATSSNTTIIPNGNISLGGSNGARTVTVTPAADRNTYSSGPITITLKVTDKDGLFSTDIFNVTVTPVNDSPAAVDDSKTLAEDALATTIDVLNNDTDVDLNNEGDLLTIDSTSTPAHGTVTIASDKKTLSFKPDANWYGNTSFTYQIKDSSGVFSNSATVSVTVTSVNDLPTAVDDTPEATLEDTPITFTVLDNDIDIDLENGGDSLSIVSTSGVTHGSTAISTVDKTITFTPAANWNGTTSFIYTMQDNAGEKSQATVYITVTPVNDPPTAVHDSVSTDQDISLKIFALSNDTDPDISLNLDTLKITEINNVDIGTASIAEDGSYITFTPEALWSGDETFDYTISDSKGETSSSTITVTVNPENDPPTAVNDSATTQEDTLVSIDVLENDTDPDLVTAGQTDNLTILSSGGSPQGTVTIAEDKKSLSFTPAANWNGTTSFTYTIQDKGSDTSTASVSVSVEAVNDDPVAVDDSASTDEDTAKTISVLSNDTDVDLSREGDTLSVYSSANGAHGTTEVSADKLSIVYTPEENWNGYDSFTYIMRDSHGKTSSATVGVSTLPINDPPMAVNDNAEVDEDGSVTIDVLNNDEDADLSREGDDLKIISFADESHGSVTIAENGKSLTFVPDANFNGTAEFTYTIEDKEEKTSSATVSVKVKPVNDAPVAQNDSGTVDEDGTITLDLLANDTDADLDQLEGDNLVILSTEGILHGHPQFTSGNKKLIYTPDPNWFGTETFTYRMKDKDDVTSSASVSVIVQPINDAPQISTIADQTIDEDSSTDELNFTVSDVDNNASDLTVSAQTSNGTFIPQGNIVLSGSGADRAVKITPAADFNTYGFSPVQITLTVSDGSLIGSSVFNITIRPVNDAPKANDDSVTMNEDTVATINPLTNDTDVDLGKEGDSLTITSISGVSKAKAVISSDKQSIKFTPDPNWFGDTTFTYTISDSHSETSTATVSVKVVDMPEAIDGWETDDSFYVKTPAGGEYYRDGLKVPVTWTPLKTSGVTYQLDFFNGESWQTIATNLDSTSYSHQLKNTNLHTSSARYRVLAGDNSGKKVVAYSNYFVIDNRPPANVELSLKTTDGNTYASDTWTRLPVIISASGGYDLTGIALKIYEGEKLLGSGTKSVKAVVDVPGLHTVSVIAVDPLGNQVTLGNYIIKIDVLPPAVPGISLSSSTATSDSTTTGGGTISFSFPADPGRSGNSTLILPDGSTVSITNDYSWTTDEDGTYTFVVVDVAGNRTQLIILVTGGEAVTEAVPDNSQPTATPTLEATIAAVFGGSAVSAQMKGLNWTADAKTVGILLGLLLLLILFFFPNVKIIYYKRGTDGKLKKVVRWKFVLPSRQKELKVKVNVAENYEIILSRALTRSLRGGCLTIAPKGPKNGASASIPDDVKNKFSARF